MAGASGGLLAAHVSLAGGFGFIGSGQESFDAFKQQLDIARSALAHATVSDDNEPTTRLPIGVGFLGWILDSRPDSFQYLQYALAPRDPVKAIWLSFGANLAHWVHFVRQTDPLVLLFIVVNSVDEAHVAINQFKPDVIVAQGIEAGGHGSASAPSVLSLVPAVLSAFSDASTLPPIVAAGGLATGDHLAAMLSLGAAGAVFGTRFLLSEESLYSSDQKSLLRDADSPFSTTRSMAFDEVRGTLGWPQGVDGRGLINDIVHDASKHLDLEKRKQLFADGILRGERGRILAWAGTGVHLINDIKPAKMVLEDLHNAAVDRVENNHRSLGA